MASDLSSPNYAGAISSVETGGQADPYTTMGPATSSGDRAHGRFQIMGANIGPWSKEILGQELTPEQFLANPQLQDQIFQGKFNQYVQKYGPEGAAKAWFAGERGMNNPNAKDSLGTSVSAYGQKFMKALGAPQAPEAAPMTQGQAPVPVSSPPMPAYGWTPNNAPAGLSGAPQSQPMPEMPALAAPQINYAHRRPPDPAHMQALLALAPALRGLSVFRNT